MGTGAFGLITVVDAAHVHAENRTLDQFPVTADLTAAPNPLIGRLT